MDGRPTLDELYTELAMEEPLDLEAFLERVAAGEWGAYSREEIGTFLDGVEVRTAGNIRLKAEEGGDWARRAREAEEEALERLRALRERYAPGT
ncbi:MAG: hypothetical protein IRZ26_08050 [Clostridia bacterium]|nr:hypothetical protein [Clostridia bacterium]